MPKWWLKRNTNKNKGSNLVHKKFKAPNQNWKNTRNYNNQVKQRLNYTTRPKNPQQSLNSSPCLTGCSASQWNQSPWKDLLLCLLWLSTKEKVWKSSIWIDNSSSSVETALLTLQTVQNKNRGAALQTPFLFLPTKGPFQPSKACQTEEGKTQATPKKETAALIPLFFPTFLSYFYVLYIQSQYVDVCNPSFEVWAENECYLSPSIKLAQLEVRI